MDTRYNKLTKLIILFQYFQQSVLNEGFINSKVEI